MALTRQDAARMSEAVPAIPSQLADAGRRPLAGSLPSATADCRRNNLPPPPLPPPAPTDSLAIYFLINSDLLAIRFPCSRPSPAPTFHQLKNELDE
jgi:hypothetical protein